MTIRISTPYFYQIGLELGRVFDSKNVWFEWGIVGQIILSGRLRLSDPSILPQHVNLACFLGPLLLTLKSGHDLLYLDVT